MKNRFAVLFLSLPFLILSCWVFYAFYFVRTAQEVVLPVQGYDPRNILSGHYIRFQINWKEADCYQADWDGVCPVADFKGINTYYIPENQAASIEEKLQSSSYLTEIVFAYHPNHRPIAKELRINGQTVLRTH